MWGIRQWVANCGVAYHLPGNMLNPTSAKQKTMEFKAAWADAINVEPIFVDELTVLDAGDRAYVTFGQLRLPALDAGQAEIRPMVRVVMTKKTLEKMFAVINRAASDTSGEKAHG
jgi:hypothetical protein